MNDLFGIKFISLRSKLNIVTFWICMDATFLIDATDRSTISNDQKRLFFAVSQYPI